MNIRVCTLCPRSCKVDRNKHRGFCRMPNTARVARAALHHWEEPPISGTNGSGAIFFSGCTLRCVFCQNRMISHECSGKEIQAKELAQKMLGLQEAGAHNINLVTGTQFVPVILESLRLIRNDLSIPVVWNTSGYETIETIDLLSEFITIWLPDLKYVTPSLAEHLSGARDYPEIALRAINRMYEHAGPFHTDETGICKSGVLVRHLLLPGERKESVAVLERLKEIVPPKDIRLSLLWQYTPEFLPEGEKYNALRRRVTTFEYDFVKSHALALGYTGYEQDRSSASKAYTPDFDIS